MGVHSVAAAHARGAERVVSVPKHVRSAYTQASLTGARTTPSARADARGIGWDGRSMPLCPQRCYVLAGFRHAQRTALSVRAALLLLFTLKLLKWI